MTEARVCVCALTEGLCEPRAAYSSDCSVELPLRPSARAAPPSGPRRLFVRLRAWERKAGAEYHVNIMSMGMNRGNVCAPGGVLQRVQRQVACETLRESGASSGTEAACHETASTGTDASVEHSVNGPLRHKQTLVAAAHLRVVIFVWHSTSASLVTPSSPIPFSARLRVRGGAGNGERASVLMGPDTQRERGRRLT